MQGRGIKLRSDLATLSEDDVQIGIAAFFFELEKKTSSFTFFHVPNGGKRPRKTAMRMKRMGQRAGVHDLIFVMKAGVTVWVELKLPGEAPRPTQTEFHEKLLSLGHKHNLVHAATPNEGITQILEILFRYGLEGVRS